jgi:molybdopterin molybdotransferase
MTHLLSPDLAREALITQTSPLNRVIMASLQLAVGKVLARSVHSPIALPPTDIAMMDGYAVRSEDIHSALPVTHRITAGDVADFELATGEACRIFTGAMLPQGVDSVVRQEDACSEGERVHFLPSVKPFRHIKKQGEEVALGQLMLAAGTRLTPAHIALCASVGLDQLPIYQPLQVALMVTGNELINPGDPLPLGKIYNSNYAMIYALLKQSGFEVTAFNNVLDNLQATVSTLVSAVSCADLVITTGGVSVGEEDHIRKAINQLGKISIWQVDMKPGRPFAFGAIEGKPIFALPGKPVAAFTIYHLFVLPALLRIQGANQLTPASYWVQADFNLGARSKKEFIAARLSSHAGKPVVVIDALKGGSILSMAMATGFIMLEAEQEIRQGDLVLYYPVTLTSQQLAT